MMDSYDHASAEFYRRATQGEFSWAEAERRIFAWCEANPFTDRDEPTVHTPRTERDLHSGPREHS